MSQIRVPARRLTPPPYVGRHRLPEQPVPPVSTRARTLEELEGTTRDLNSPNGVRAAARAVMGLSR